MTTDERLPDRWYTRDYPMLLQAARRLDDGVQMFRASEIAEESQRALPEVLAAFEALVPTYVKGQPIETAEQGTLDFELTGLTERGRRAVGLWPSGESADALVDALRQAEEATDDPQEKGAIRRAVGAVGAVSRDIMVDVFAAVLAKQSGLG